MAQPRSVRPSRAAGSTGIEAIGDAFAGTRRGLSHAASLSGSDAAATP